MTDHVVTKEEIVRLIKDEHLRPEDLYSPEDLDGWKLRAEVERRVAEEKKAEEERRENPDPKGKYLNPKTNPLL